MNWSGMRTIPVIFFWVISFYTPCLAGDFIVEFVRENYRETTAPSSNDPVIYHSIQVKSKAGPKLLVLKGDEYHYRKWLRQYIAQGKQLIAQIPDDQDDLFISSTTFDINLTDLHPVNLSRFLQDKKENRSGAGLTDSLPEGLFDTGTGAGKNDALERNNKKRQDNLKEKQREADRKNKAAQKRLSKERQEQARKLQQRQKEQDEQKARQLQELKEALERQDQERRKILAAREKQLAQDEQRRRQEMEQRWEELKRRMLEDERLRNMALEERNREIQRRWLELQQRYGVN